MKTERSFRSLSVLAALALSVVLAGCAFNRPDITDEQDETKVTAVTRGEGTNAVTTTTTNTTHVKRSAKVPTWAVWPATSTLEKQRVTVGKTVSIGTEGLKEEGGGTNVTESLRALGDLVGKLHP